MTVKPLRFVVAALLMSHALACTDGALEADPASVGVGARRLMTVRVGSVTQKDRIGEGWWVTSRVTLHDNGVILGLTDLQNYHSLFGYTAGVVVALVDANKDPLYYAPAGSWGLNACGVSCPSTRAVPWSVQVPADVWQRIAPEVRGVAIIQRQDPTNRIGVWVLEHRQEVISLIKAVATLF